VAIAYGVTPTGFYAKPLSVVEDEIDSGIKGILGESAGTDADGKIPLDSMAGQLKVLLVDGFSAQWDLQEAVYTSKDPGSAAGTSLDIVGSLTGSRRRAERRSVATGLCVGVPLTSLEAGRVATVRGTTSRFATATGVQLATGLAYVGATTYPAGDVRYIPGQNRHYLCLGTGLGNASGPSGTAAAIVASGTTWLYLGEGVGIVKAPFVSEVVGAIGVATGSLGDIATPVDGWNAVYNPAAGIAGATVEKDSGFRARRDNELAAAGNTTADAIRANILAVNASSEDPAHQPATSCTVFFNDTDVTDANGVPPHSVEILVLGGTTGDIAQAIWDSVGAGTRTYGTTSANAVDSEGTTQVVYFTRPTEVPIWVIGVGRYDASQWLATSNPNAVVAQSMLSAFLTYTADWPAKLDVRQSPLTGALMRGPAGTTGGVAIVPADPASPPVPGLLEVETLYFGTATGPASSAQIAIGAREIATFDSSRCDFTATSEDP
jgi:hypothetical protein